MDILSQLSLFFHSELQNKKDYCKTFSAILGFFGGPKNGQIWSKIQIFCKNPSYYGQINPYKCFGPFKIIKLRYFNFWSF